MSSTDSGIALRSASSSTRDPIIPERLAPPPAKVKLLRSSRHPAGVLLSTAGLVSRSGRPSSVPDPVIE